MLQGCEIGGTRPVVVFQRNDLTILFEQETFLEVPLQLEGTERIPIEDLFGRLPRLNQRDHLPPGPWVLRIDRLRAMNKQRLTDPGIPLTHLTQDEMLRTINYFKKIP